MHHETHLAVHLQLLDALVSADGNVDISPGELSEHELTERISTLTKD